MLARILFASIFLSLATFSAHGESITVGAAAGYSDSAIGSLGTLYFPVPYNVQDFIRFDIPAGLDIVDATVPSPAYFLVTQPTAPDFARFNDPGSQIGSDITQQQYVDFLNNHAGKSVFFDAWGPADPDPFHPTLTLTVAAQLVPTGVPLPATLAELGVLLSLALLWTSNHSKGHPPRGGIASMNDSK